MFLVTVSQNFMFGQGFQPPKGVSILGLAMVENHLDSVS